jgi:ABC-type microcin C transport system permease subunit YejB
MIGLFFSLSLMIESIVNVNGMEILRVQSVPQNLLFRYSVLMRNRGLFVDETLKN